MEGISANWRTSSYSGANGGNCVEVANTSWRKSSHSDSNGGQCVEVGPAAHHAAIPSVPVRDTTDRAAQPGVPVRETTGRAAQPGVLVRDTTDRTGPVLRIRPAAWRALTAAIREGRTAARP